MHAHAAVHRSSHAHVASGVSSILSMSISISIDIDVAVHRCSHTHVASSVSSVLSMRMRISIDTDSAEHRCSHAHVIVHLAGHHHLKLRGIPQQVMRFPALHLLRRIQVRPLVCLVLPQTLHRPLGQAR